MVIHSHGTSKKPTHCLDYDINIVIKANNIQKTKSVTYIYSLTPLKRSTIFYFMVFSTLNPFPNKPWFLRVFNTGLLKTLWEKGEIARDEQFLPFPHFFLPF